MLADAVYADVLCECMECDVLCVCMECDVLSCGVHALHACYMTCILLLI